MSVVAFILNTASGILIFTTYVRKVPTFFLVSKDFSLVETKYFEHFLNSGHVHRDTSKIYRDNFFTTTNDLILNFSAPVLQQNSFDSQKFD